MREDDFSESVYVGEEQNLLPLYGAGAKESFVHALNVSEADWYQLFVSRHDGDVVGIECF